MSDSEKIDKLNKRQERAFNRLKRDNILQKIIDSEGELDIRFDHFYFGTARGADAVNEIKRHLGDILGDGLNRNTGGVHYERASKDGSTTLEIEKDSLERLKRRKELFESGEIKESKPIEIKKETEQKTKGATPTEPLELKPKVAKKYIPPGKFPPVIDLFEMGEDYKKSLNTVNLLDDIIKYNFDPEVHQEIRKSIEDADIRYEPSEEIGDLIEALQSNKNLGEKIKIADPLVGQAMELISSDIEQITKAYDILIEELENEQNKMISSRGKEVKIKRMVKQAMIDLDAYTMVLDDITDHTISRIGNIQSKTTQKREVTLYQFSYPESKYHVLVVPDGNGVVSSRMNETIEELWYKLDGADRRKEKNGIVYTSFSVPNDLEDMINEELSDLKEAANIDIYLEKKLCE